jgi:lipopolysaccharide/colanic/teichoic acid biosynthesis glycosyltransferase
MNRKQVAKTNCFSPGSVRAFEKNIQKIEIPKESFLKRPFDFLLSLMGMVISVPLWILIPASIWLESRRPIFYYQYRVGKRGKVFRVRKFRSMIKDAEKHSGAVWAEENDSRVTRVGKILRATAMDELPQLLSILKGDMSFVGPRPERPELVARFNGEIPNYSLRHLVKPGLTGVAQIFGQYDTPPKHKLKYDLLYVKKQNFWLDLKLMFLSFVITFKGKWESRERKI